MTPSPLLALGAASQEMRPRQQLSGTCCYVARVPGQDSPRTASTSRVTFTPSLAGMVVYADS